MKLELIKVQNNGTGRLHGVVTRNISAEVQGGLVVSLGRLVLNPNFSGRFQEGIAGNLALGCEGHRSGMSPPEPKSFF